MNIADILSEPNRKWRARPAAGDAQIADLVKQSQISLPVEYLELLRATNGGEGELAFPPLWLQLYSVEECIELIHDPSMKDCRKVPQSSDDLASPDFFVFASNGGLESIAFDLRNGPSLPIVMIDPIAGPESAIQIAPDIVTFIQAIGIEAGR
jgi:SMI1 / KNR4 family (SUKH-1)